MGLRLLSFPFPIIQNLDDCSLMKIQNFPTSGYQYYNFDEPFSYLPPTFEQPLNHVMQTNLNLMPIVAHKSHIILLEKPTHFSWVSSPPFFGKEQCCSEHISFCFEVLPVLWLKLYSNLQCTTFVFEQCFLFAIYSSHYLSKG